MFFFVFLSSGKKNPPLPTNLKKKKKQKISVTLAYQTLANLMHKKKDKKRKK